MKGKGGEGGNMRGEVYEGRHSFLRGILFFFGGVLLDLHRGEFEFCSREGLVQGAPVCWGFWARGPGYPYGILELGSCPSWQGGNSVLGRVGPWLQAGQGSSKVNKTSGKRRVSIRPRYFKFTYLFYSVMKLLFVDKFNMRMC
jgi:hypothetical protein